MARERDGRRLPLDCEVRNPDESRGIVLCVYPQEHPGPHSWEGDPLTHLSESRLYRGITPEAAAGYRSLEDMDDDDGLAYVNWWMDTARQDWERFGPKLAEYGARDLTDIGRDLAHMLGWDNCPERAMTELGIYFYLRGKVARMQQAFQRHQLPSDDTYMDADVYCTMLRRVREAGRL